MGPQPTSRLYETQYYNSPIILEYIFTLNKQNHIKGKLIHFSICSVKYSIEFRVYKTCPNDTIIVIKDGQIMDHITNIYVLYFNGLFFKSLLFIN